MRKGYSLHIGVNSLNETNYGTKGSLQFCEADAVSFQEIAQKNGYTTKLLVTESATTSNVLLTLKEYSNNTETGDIVFITYSGHGSQIWDLNGDEDDYLDETWCLYDRQLIDDELYNAFMNFKAGVRIFVISDSCHSGTVLKAMLYSDSINGTQRSLDTLGEGQNFEKNKTEYEEIKAKLKGIENSPVKADVQLFAACQDNQTALEFGGHGAYTTSILKVYNQINNSDLTYDAFFTKAQSVAQAITREHQKPNLFRYGTKVTDWGAAFKI